MAQAQQYIAIGVFNGEIYGPYTQEDFDLRAQSGTPYSDRLQFPEEGESFDAFYKRMQETYE